MAYEIPQQLQHKERIIFGLTFEQIGWALLFGTLALLAFTAPVPTGFKYVLAGLPALTGVLFMFFNAEQFIKNLFLYFRFRKADLGTPNMHKLLGLKKVEGEVMITDRNVAVLQVTPINYSIKTTEEQEAINYGFQKFLNSLDHSIQIVIISEQLNIDTYLSNLKKRTKNEELHKSFSKFMKDKILEEKTRNRLFYIVIPEMTNIDIQVDICIERLKSLGLGAERISAKKLLLFLARFFNPDNDERRTDSTDSSVQYLVAPNSVEEEFDHLQVNKKMCRIVAATGYPRSVEPGFLDRLIRTNDDFDMSIHIEPFSIDSTMILLNKELQKQRADLYAEEQKHSINPSLEIKYSDTRKVLEELQKGSEKLFNVSLYIQCKAKSLKDLNFLTKKVESELNSTMIMPQTPLFRQAQAYQSMMPFANDVLKLKRNITTRALSAFFPFTSPFLTVENEGIMLGLNKNNIPYIKDIYKLSNANGVVLATSGSGKSYFTKLYITRQLANNTKVIVIDPQGEYRGLVEQAGGELINISRNSESIINPLDLMGHDYIEKRLTLIDLFRIMFGELSDAQRSILDRAINETYSKKGIRPDDYIDKKAPILGDLYKTLTKMDKKASSLEKMTYRALLNRLYMFTHGAFNFMNKPTKIDFEKDFVCFNIGNMPKQVQPVVMFLILDYVYTRMKGNKERKLLVVDEAWSLLGHAEEASYLFEIVKTCRKFNLGLLLITQDVADLLGSKAGHAALANSSYTFLLRQKPAVIDSVVRTFHLSQPEKEYLLTATEGKGILILDNEHQELKVISSKEEHALITTNPNETTQTPEVKKEMKEVNIKLNPDKPYHKSAGLDDEQLNYLINHNYERGSHCPIGKSRGEEFWVKKNGTESAAHTFLVHNFREELSQYTKDSEVFVSNNPDVVFKHDDKEYGVEVETGMNFDKHRKRLIQKFAEVSKKYGSRLVVLITDATMRKQYRAILPQGTKLIVRSEVPDWLKETFTKNVKKHVPKR